MTDLVESVQDEERSLACLRCGTYVEPVFSESGPHIRADCPQCGRYIKFAKRKVVQVEEPQPHDEADAAAWRSDAQAFYVLAYKGRSPERNFNKSESAERIWRWMGGTGCLFDDLGKSCPDDGIRLCLECRQ